MEEWNENGEIPKEILAIDTLDHEKALDHCGDAEDYVDALVIYERSIDDKVKDIKECFEKKDIDNYVFKVHSLKSMSLAIGAVSIFEMAKALEEAGKNKDTDVIERDTGKLIEALEALGAALRDALSSMGEI